MLRDGTLYQPRQTEPPSQFDDTWLRILGSGNDEHHLASLGQINENTSGGILVAQDVLGGKFAWVSHVGGKPTMTPHCRAGLDSEFCEPRRVAGPESVPTLCTGRCASGRGGLQE